MRTCGGRTVALRRSRGPADSLAPARRQRAAPRPGEFGEGRSARRYRRSFPSLARSRGSGQDFGCLDRGDGVGVDVDTERGNPHSARLAPLRNPSLLVGPDGARLTAGSGKDKIAQTGREAGKRGCDVRRLTVVLASLCSVQLTAVPSQAAAPGGTLSVSGMGDRSVTLHVDEPLHLVTSMMDLLGGRPAGRLNTPYFGFAVMRSLDGHVVAGRLRSAVFEQSIGSAIGIPLGDPQQLLQPGDYRVILLGRGPLSLRVHSKEKVQLTARVATPVQVSYSAGSLRSSLNQLVPEHRARLSVNRTFVSLGSLTTGGTVGLAFDTQCLSTAGARTCVGADPGPAGGSSLALTSSQGSVSSGNQWQPGEVTAGEYDALFQANPEADSVQHLWTLLAIGASS